MVEWLNDHREVVLTVMFVLVTICIVIIAISLLFNFNWFGVPALAFLLYTNWRIGKQVDWW